MQLKKSLFCKDVARPTLLEVKENKNSVYDYILWDLKFVRKATHEQYMNSLKKPGLHEKQFQSNEVITPSDSFFDDNEDMSTKQAQVYDVKGGEFAVGDENDDEADESCDHEVEGQEGLASMSKATDSGIRLKVRLDPFHAMRRITITLKKSHVSLVTFYNLLNYLACLCSISFKVARLFLCCM